MIQLEISHHLCWAWGHLVGATLWAKDILHFFQAWGLLIGAMLWNQAGHQLCQTWGHLLRTQIGVEVRTAATSAKLKGTCKMLCCKPKPVATCTGLEGVWERQQYKPRLADTCVELEGPWKGFQWALRPSAACVEGLKSLDQALPDLAGWVGLGLKKMLRWKGRFLARLMDNDRFCVQLH